MICECLDSGSPSMCGSCGQPPRRVVTLESVVTTLYNTGGVMVALNEADIEVMGDLVHITTMQRLTFDQALVYRYDVLHIPVAYPLPPADAPFWGLNGTEARL